MNETLEVVRLGWVTIHGILPAHDTTVEEALDQAEEMLEHGDPMDSAYVDPKYGLVIFNCEALKPTAAGKVCGFRLQMAAREHGNAGMLIAALVLVLFGFGRTDELYRRLALDAASTSERHELYTKETAEGIR